MSETNIKAIQTNQVQYIIVDAERAGQRLDNYLMNIFSRKLPKTLLYRWIRKGELRINKKRVKQTYRVQLGDEIRIPPFHAPEAQPEQHVGRMDLSYLKEAIIFENHDYLIINKPQGLAVHGSHVQSPGLIERLRILYPDIKKLELVHRLDKGTSGCLIVAKTYAALKFFHEQLRSRTIIKKYHALVEGKMKKERYEANFSLERITSASGERFVKVCQQNNINTDITEGKHAAHTTIKPLKIIDNTITLIEAQPHTGKTHQIRVHLQALGHPILGDHKYNAKNAHKTKRLCLHAFSLQFVDMQGDTQYFETTSDF